MFKKSIFYNRLTIYFMAAVLFTIKQFVYNIFQKDTGDKGMKFRIKHQTERTMVRQPDRK